jgi:hypothetical protein
MKIAMMPAKLDPGDDVTEPDGIGLPAPFGFSGRRALRQH